MKLSIETKIQSIGNLYENTNSHTKANHRFATHQMVQELDLNQRKPTTKSSRLQLAAKAANGGIGFDLRSKPCAPRRYTNEALLHLCD